MMSLRPQSLLAGLVLVGLGTTLVVPPPAASAAASTTRVVADHAHDLAVAQSTEEFMQKFRQAMKVGATDEMNRLVRTQQENAVYKIIEICEAIANGSNERLEDEIAALRKAWKAVHKTQFPDEVYEFFSLLSSSIKEHRNSLKKQYQQQNKNFVDAEKAKDDTKFGEIGMLMKGLGEAFEEIGDYYYASQAYLHWGKANDEYLRGEKADLKQAHDAFLKCVETRERVDLKDIFYSQAKQRQQHLEAAGYGATSETPGEAEAVKEGAALTLVPTFEVVESVDDVRRPIYTGDPIYMMWPGIQMREKGSTTKFHSLKDLSPSVIRSASSKVMIDTNGDGEGDVDIPMTGKLVPVQLQLNAGEGPRDWAFLAAVGGQRDTFNGIQFNASPSDNFLNIYIAPAASIVADVAGTPIRILDDNMDGIYGSDPMPWQHTGLADSGSDNFQWDVDSVVVGGAKAAQPWSEHLKIGDTWYRMESDPERLEIRATPLQDLKTGKVKLDLKGVSADWVILRGSEGTPNENTFIEIANAKTVEAPAGRYELFGGQVSKGKKSQMAKALMVPWKNTPAWTITAGETTSVKLGAPFGFDFETTQDGESLTVVGTTISVVGAGNESYQRLWNCVVRPEVSIREEGAKRGSKGEDMKGPGSQEELAQHGFQYAWFPFDLTLPKKKDVAHEAMLFQKKNKLFGKIESVWR